MNFIKYFIIKLAYSWIAKKHSEELDELKWENQDSINLDDFLKTESGKKFHAMMGVNATRSLNGLMNAKTEDEIRSVKAQAKVWQTLGSNLSSMRIQRKDPNDRKISKEKLEEIFSKMVSGSIQVNRHAMK